MKDIPYRGQRTLLRGSFITMFIFLTSIFDQSKMVLSDKITMKNSFFKLMQEACKVQSYSIKCPMFSRDYNFISYDILQNWFSNTIRCFG